MSGHQRPHRGKSDDWLTPPEIISALGPFTLDPCCPQQMPWPTASIMLHSPQDDGLTQPWFGTVWLNPPFGPDAEHWVKRLADHGNGMALVAARTETHWWFEHIWSKASAILFLRKRPHFHFPNGDRAPFNSGVPIAIAAYGRGCARKLGISRLDGCYVKIAGCRIKGGKKK